MKIKLNCQNLIYTLVFILILGIAAFFRLYGLNWDAGQHLNPDERFLTLVATSLKWPNSIFDYFDTDSSLLNPQNTGNSFYVYGTWPVILVKAVAEVLHKGDYGNLTLVGRVMSAIADLITLVLVFIITKRLLKLSSPTTHNSSLENQNISPLIAMSLYAIMALPIQLSHFYTTDPFVTLTITATLLCLTYTPTIYTGIVTGLIFGLALAAKISAAPFISLILLAIGLHFWKSKKGVQLLLYGLSFGLISYCSLRLFMPYLFADTVFFSFHFNPKVIDNWKQLMSFNDPKAWFPPSVQWIHTTPYLFPLLQLIFIGLGLPLALMAGAALAWAVTQIKQNRFLLLPLSFCLLNFVYQGYQFSKPMRYFYPMYPSLAVLIGIFLSSLMIQNFRRPNSKFQILLIFTFCFLLLTSLVWPISQMSIYSRPNTRVAASLWIYAHIPSGSTLTMEHWDDGLPLNFPGFLNSQYKTLELPMYGMDNPEKWKEIHEKLAEVDYLILSSNRVYGSITSAPERYPETYLFYRDLFSGKLGFTPVAIFASRPTLPIPGIHISIPIPFFYYGIIDTTMKQYNNGTIEQLNNGISFIDDYVDETWTVYDHPKVLIFRNTQKLAP